MLGSAYDALPAQVQALHDTPGQHRWSGTAQVRRGTGRVSRLVAAVIGFPKAGADVPVTVTFSPDHGIERWTRDFGGRRFTSWQRRGAGRNEALLVERFGVIEVALALLVEGDRLLLVPRRWSLLGVPLPKALLPRGTTFETDVDGRFVFNVEIAAPGVGLIVAYRGSLQPAG